MGSWGSAVAYLHVLVGGIQKNLPEAKTATLNPDSSGIYF